MERSPQNRTWVLQKKHFCWVPWHTQIHLARQQLTAVLNQSVPCPPPTTLDNFSPNLTVTLDDSFPSVWKKIILRRVSSTIFPSFPGKLSRSLASILYSRRQKVIALEHGRRRHWDSSPSQQFAFLTPWKQGLTLQQELKRSLWHPLQEKPNWCTMNQQKRKAAVSTYQIPWN